MDVIRFQIKFEPFKDEPATNMLAIEGLINDKLVCAWEDLSIDVMELLNSKDESGNYDIWTCVCGIPSCAGVYKQIRVEHKNDIVVWSNLDGPLSDFKELQFDKEMYVRTIESFWKSYRQFYLSYINSKIEFELCPDMKKDEIVEMIFKN